MITTVLECLKCEKTFSELDILTFQFFPTTRICYNCYRVMQKAPFSVSCFGKRSDKTGLGYDTMAEECRTHCPDRRLCPRFMNGTIKKLRATSEESTEVQKVKQEPVNTRKYPYRSGTMTDKAFKLCMGGVKIPRLKSWCKRKGTSYYRLVRLFKKQTAHGKKWHFENDGKTIRVVYHIRKA